MRRFEALVMSETEPVTEGTLWLRKKHNTIGPKPNEVPPVGMSIWWFGEQGWQPMYDLDTRYELNDSFDYAAVGVKPIEVEITPSPEVGIVNIEKTYSMYSGNRTLGNNANFVNETGLKKHVDDLQAQIDALKVRVATLEGKVATLESQVATHSTQIANNRSSITTLSGRVSALETAS